MKIIKKILYYQILKKNQIYFKLFKKIKYNHFNYNSKS
jgi:hypothetical protein